MKAIRFFGFFLLSIMIFSGCNNTSKTDVFYGIEMLKTVDKNRFNLERTDNNGLKNYISKESDSLFNTIKVVADKDDKIIRIILIDNFKQSSNEPFQLASTLLSDLQKKYGTFNCIKDSIDLLGQKSEICTAVYNNNLIQLYVSEWKTDGYKSLSINYINNDYNKYDNFFKNAFDKVNSASKL